MKFLIASDIHGSRIYAQRVADLLGEEGADRLILLGDIYNHGPRNPLPEGYDPMGVAKILNGLVDRLTVIKGNCDSDVDTMISDFEFVSEGVLIAEGKKILRRCVFLRPLSYGVHRTPRRRARRKLRLGIPPQKRDAAQLSLAGRRPSFAQRSRQKRHRGGGYLIAASPAARSSKQLKIYYVYMR